MNGDGYSECCECGIEKPIDDLETCVFCDEHVCLQCSLLLVAPKDDIWSDE